MFKPSGRSNRLSLNSYEKSFKGVDTLPAILLPPIERKRLNAMNGNHAKSMVKAGPGRSSFEWILILIAL
jgi:hypothetical protein